MHFHNNNDIVVKILTQIAAEEKKPYKKIKNYLSLNVIFTLRIVFGISSLKKSPIITTSRPHIAQVVVNFL